MATHMAPGTQAAAASASTLDAASIDSRRRANGADCIASAYLRRTAGHGSPADGARPVTVLWWPLSTEPSWALCLAVPGRGPRRGEGASGRCWRQNAHNAAMDHAVGCAVSSPTQPPARSAWVTTPPSNRLRQPLQSRASSVRPAEDSSLPASHLYSSALSLRAGPLAVPADMTAYATVGIPTRTAQMASLHMDLINTGRMSRTPPPFRCAST
ncbi:hypothetical protein PSPO01_11265 [Paraphaeosphaeria sporulosa]